MSPPIPSSPRSSRAFEPLALEPRPSRWLIAGWVAVHAMVAGAVAALDRGPLLAAAGAVALVVHAWWRRPPPTPAVRRDAEGRWSVPALGVAAADLAPGTLCHPQWVRLVFDVAAPLHRRPGVLLLRDQLDVDSWRALQAALRRATADDFGERSADFR